MNPHYPHHTPPNPPQNMKWKYQGEGWSNRGEICTYYTVDPGGFTSIVWENTHPLGGGGYHYFQAIPEIIEEDILLEALRITKEDRQNQYGPPNQDFARTAALWSALFADKMTTPFEARDVAMAMICLKLSRETHQKKRDNSTDIAGYARCLHLCNESTE